MRNFPSRIEIITEPSLYSTRDDFDAIQLTLVVRINGREVSSRIIRPLDFFVSHFDRVIEEAKCILKKELFD